MRYEEIKDRLRAEYDRLFYDERLRPEWAVRKTARPEEAVRPTIPFIGREYACRSIRMLLYASAENLAGYNRFGRTYLDDDEFAADRHRACFEEDKDSFFPDVHIAPVNGGELSLAAYYIACKLTDVRDMKPSEFYETMAFGNYGKFSIASGANIDYASKKTHLCVMREYVRADIGSLRPDIIIMPGSIYRAEREFLDDICKGVRIIPMHQINCRVINCHIHPRYQEMPPSSLPEDIRLWYDNIRGISGATKRNYLSVFSYLDDICQ